MLTGNKSLPESMLTKIVDVVWVNYLTFSEYSTVLEQCNYFEFNSICMVFPLRETGQKCCLCLTQSFINSQTIYGKNNIYCVFSKIHWLTQPMFWHNEPVSLTHWGSVMHICIYNVTSIGSDNGLSPGWCQATIWTNAGILLIGPLGFESVICEMVAILSRPQCVK